MARPLRIEYDGAFYHITARGNEGNPLYRGGGDYQKFLEIFSELPQRYGVIIHGYVLMGNHYHLLIETPQGNITRVMHYLNSVYTGYFNKEHKRLGHLFQGRYKGFLIEKERYLLAVSRYIHLNPVRAGIVERPEEYRWSSYPAYIGKRKREELLTYEWILGQYSKDEGRAQRLYRTFVEEGMRLKANPFNDLKGGFIIGSEGFIEEIKKKIRLKRDREIPASKRLIRSPGYGEIIAAVAKRFGISEQGIREVGRRSNVARKVSLYLLRRLTDLSNEEIAGYFGIGYTAVSQATSRVRSEMKENRRLKHTIQELERELLREE